MTSPWQFDGSEPCVGYCGVCNDDTFDIGDVVSLIVGGPDMVVISVCECGTVEVAWADSDGDVCVDVFPEEVLVHIDE